MGTDAPAHRPGAFKQKNKSHNSGKHKSKGVIYNINKGRADIKSTSKKKARDLKRHERRHQAQQLRQNSRAEVLDNKRKLGTATSAPFLVTVVSLHDSNSTEEAINLLCTADSDSTFVQNERGHVHLSVPRLKQRFTFVTAPKNNINATLDYCKVASTVMFLASPNGIDPLCMGLLTAISLQGLPTPLVVVPGLKANAVKKIGEIKRMVEEDFSKTFPVDRVLSLHDTSDAQVVLRHLGNQKQRPVVQRDRRSHLLAEKVEQLPGENDALVTLKVSGYVRYQPLNVDGLVHIPGLGDFQIQRIELPDDPYPLNVNKRKNENERMELEEGATIFAECDPSLQTSVQSERIPEDMGGEEGEDIGEIQENLEVRRAVVKKVTKGVGGIQGEWLVATNVLDDDNNDDSEDDSSDDGSDDDDDDDLSNDDLSNSEECEMDTQTVCDLESKLDTVSFAPEPADYDNDFDMREEEETHRKIREAQENEMYPDEIETPADIPARVRWQKYRGLKSFSTSVWEPLEEKPSEYNRIWHFPKFSRTCRRILKQEPTGALEGWFVNVLVKNVPRVMLSDTVPIVLVGLKPCEQLMTTMHFVLKRRQSDPNEQCLPVRSKDRLTFHCGYRRFSACPIFSEHSKGNKFKFVRFFDPNSTVVATTYCPMMVPPSSVLVFREEDGYNKLIANGSVLSADSNRVIVKRAMLSGHPYKIHKKSSVIRYMFNTPDDILWFKSVELQTKLGRRGNIKMPLGTHGHMKCIFNGPLKAHDVIFMPLYKRIFPKWSYDPEINFEYL